jgi:uncharacterized iron-regulated protein
VHWYTEGMRSRLLVLSAVMLVSACAHRESFAPAAGFRHALGREHPLSGRVWSPGENRFVPPALLLSHVRASRWLVLGETHDNVDHHLLEARLVDAFLSTHPQASVALEMLDETQAPALAEPGPRSASELAERVRWADSGWPDFALYEPVFRAVFAGGGRVVAAHPSRAHVKASMAGVPDELRAPLKLEAALPKPLHDTFAQEIRDSHCGYAPEGMVVPMVRAQTFKDAWMARALVDAGAPALLIAGRGHADEQRGVPRYLRAHGIDPVLTVAFMDVAEGREQPRDYDVAAYDFVVFTPRTTDESACERFKKQLERMQHAPASAPAHGET